VSKPTLTEVTERLADATLALADEKAGINDLPLPPRYFRRKFKSRTNAFLRLGWAKDQGLISAQEEDEMLDARAKFVQQFMADVEKARA
jgi:hypothetical protein